MILYRDKIDLDEQPSAPALPSAGSLNLYADSGGGLIAQNTAGATQNLLGQIYPERLALWGAMSADILARGEGANTFIGIASSHRHRMVSFLVPGRSGEIFSYRVPLSHGNYTMKIIGLERDDGGSIAIKIDGDVVAVRSTYSSTATSNIVHTVAFSLAQSGQHDIEIGLIANGANTTQLIYALLTKILLTKD